MTWSYFNHFDGIQWVKEKDNLTVKQTMSLWQGSAFIITSSRIQSDSAKNVINFCFKKTWAIWNIKIKMYPKPSEKFMNNAYNFFRVPNENEIRLMSSYFRWIHLCIWPEAPHKIEIGNCFHECLCRLNWKIEMNWFRSCVCAKLSTTVTIKPIKYCYSFYFCRWFLISSYPVK